MIITENDEASDILTLMSEQGQASSRAVRIGSDVWIGAKSIIHPSVHIGDDSIIGVGNVSTKRVPEYVIVRAIRPDSLNIGYQLINAEYKTFSPESAFLRQFFDCLNQSTVRYAVLRNYITLPYSAGDSDLDILIHPEDEVKVRAIIAEAASKAGGVAIGYANTVGFFKTFLFGREELNAGEWWGLCLDINIGLRYAGVAQLLGDDVLKNRCCLHNGICVLPNNLAAVLGIVKELLHNNILSPRYLALAADAAKENWDELDVDLAPMGESALVLLRDMCLSMPDSSGIVTKSRALRYAILRTAFLRSPLTYFRFRFLREWSKVSRFAKPSGMVVAILGTDGVGKSTIITAIEPTLSAATHGAFIVKHLRPGLLPPLARLKGKQAQQNGPVTDPHKSSPSGSLGSLLRVVYLIIDYVLGYWLVVRPKIAKAPTIVLFDRYAYDMALDPRRFRIGLSRRLVWWFARFAPKPDLIICLHGDPDIIVARKQELPLEEVRRQTAALLDFAKHEPRAVLISTEGTVEQARNDLLRALKIRITSRNVAS